TRTRDQRLKRPLLYRLSYQPAEARETSLPHRPMQDFPATRKAVFSFVFRRCCARLPPIKTATRVKFWGVRGSIPTPGPATVRYGGNTSCVEVRSGDDIIILDAGSGLR